MGRGATLITASLILTGFLIEKIGYFICAFLVSLLVLKINGIKSWMLIIFFSLSSCVAFFIFFNLFLSVRLPLGMLQFGVR